MSKIKQMTHSLEEAKKIIDEQKDQLLEAERTTNGLKIQVATRSRPYMKH